MRVKSKYGHGEGTVVTSLRLSTGTLYGVVFDLPQNEPNYWKKNNYLGKFRWELDSWVDVIPSSSDISQEIEEIL